MKTQWSSLAANLRGHKIFWIFILLGLGLGVYFYISQKAEKTTQQVLNLDSMTVQKATLLQRITIAGTVQPARKSFITASYKGYVQKLFVKLGDSVKAGDPIASVATSLTTNEQVFPLRSPISGKIVQLPKTDGEFVKEADPTDFIARIDDMSQLFVSANTPEMERTKIQVGQEAVVKASPILDRTYKGIVRQVSLSANETDKWQRSSVVEYPIRLELVDFDDQIKPGMSVLIDIIAQKRENVLVLRHEYIQRDKDQFVVTLASGERRNVKLGLQNEEGAEIMEGLKVGDKVRKVDFSALAGDK
jgi:multidrug efflux pump subunit AcrA (membrane-fusion protein)